MTGRIQVVNVTPRAGTSKAGKPFSMLIVDGVFTADDGKRATCEHVIFADEHGALPSVVVGAVYEPITTTYVNRDKKLSAGVFELKPVKAAA